MNILERLEVALITPTRIAVVGDLMLDKHVWCTVKGISPEDDLAPKLVPERTEFALGGAANVAANLKALGVAEVYLYGQNGDESGAYHSVFKRLARAAGITLRWSDGPPLSIKTRYLTTNGRHVCRVDEETIRPMGDVEWIVRSISGDYKSSDGPFPFVVISDYGKGVVTPELVKGLQQKSRLIVDPKGSDWSKYGTPYVITPNEHEARVARHVAKRFEYGCLADYVVETLSRDGCRIHCCYDRTVDHYLFNQALSTRPREVGDPTGCGDSFTAGMAYALASGLEMRFACSFANACGACAFDHVGVRAVKREEVIAELKTFKY